MLPVASKILVVDDMNTMVTMIRNALGQLGYDNVIQARNGLEAWERLTDYAGTLEPVRLVFSDWNMPDMTGLEFLKKTKESPATKGTFFVMITANRGSKERTEAFESGVNGYITKPFTVVQMKDCLEKLTFG